MYDDRRPAKHWLYRYVPFGSGDANGWRKLTWAIFGNDDDGIFGEGAKVWWPEVAKEKATFWIAVRWWCRNPMHNLFTRVIAWRRENVRGLYLRHSIDELSYRRFWFVQPQDSDFWPAYPEHSMLRIHLVPPLLMWRETQARLPNEGYFGWKPAGHFGMAWRRANSAMM